MYNYLEIRRFGDEKVCKRLDITGKSEREISRLDDGVNRNLNHESFFTTECEYNDAQELDPKNYN